MAKAKETKQTKEEVEFDEEIISDVEELVHDIWVMMGDKFGKDLSQEEMNNLYAALGIVAGMGMLEAFEYDALFPFHLQGVLSDFTYQTFYSSRFGIDFGELESQKENPH